MFAQFNDLATIRFKGVQRQFQGSGHADRKGNGFGSWPLTLLLVAAPKKRAQLGVFFYQKRANPFWAMKFVSTQSQGSDRQPPKGDAYFARGCRRIAVKRCLPVANTPGPPMVNQLFYGLNGAGFMIGEHDGNEPSVRGDLGFKTDNALAGDG